MLEKWTLCEDVCGGGGGCFQGLLKGTNRNLHYLINPKAIGRRSIVQQPCLAYRSRSLYTFFFAATNQIHHDANASDGDLCQIFFPRILLNL